MEINREELNKYYEKINLLVDEYVEKWKIRPSQLKKYFKTDSNNFNRLLEKSGISNFNVAKRILLDVLDDRLAEEVDGVLKFESFSLFESVEYKVSSIEDCLYKGINKADINMEKSIADYFDTNLGDIDIVDSEKHIFSINDWQGSNLKVISYSDDDIEIILENLIDFIYDDLMSKEIEIIDNLSIKVSNIISGDKIREEIKNAINDKTIELITKILGTDTKYQSYVGHVHLWTE